MLIDINFSYGFVICSVTYCIAKIISLATRAINITSLENRVSDFINLHYPSFTVLFQRYWTPLNNLFHLLCGLCCCTNWKSLFNLTKSFFKSTIKFVKDSAILQSWRMQAAGQSIWLLFVQISIDISDWCFKNTIKKFD